MSSGGGDFSLVAPTTTVNIKLYSGGIAPIPLTGGSGMAAWEVRQTLRQMPWSTLVSAFW